MHDDVKNSTLSDSGVAENERRLELLCEIGRILALTEKVRAAAPPILETICRSLNFEVGELWILDETETSLKLKSSWHFPTESFARFADESQAIEFSIGEGLPGRVWRHNAPVWVEKLNAENNLPRLPIAQRAGLQSAFAFPVLLGEKFLGAFCFFCERQCPHDEALLQMFTAVGGNIGQFIKRERTESDLRESEENFRALVQASSQAIWTTDPAGQNLEAYGWWENQTGQTRQESAGAGFLDAIHPDDRKRISREWQTAMRRVESFETECRINDRRGAYQYFAVRGVPVYNADGSFRQWIGTLTDISDRKLAEQSLKSNEERYRALVEATSTVVWRATPDGKLSFVGSVWETVSGQRVEEILGAGWLDAIHPDDRERTIKVWRHSLATKEIYETEFRVLTTGGEYRWFAVRGVPILDDAGEVREWVGANTDVHEHKLAEEQIEASEERYRSLFETIDEGFCLCEMLFDADGKPFDYRFLEVNPIFEQMTGLENAAGRTALELIPNLEAHWFETYGKVVSTGEPIRFTDRSEAMNRWFDLYASPVGDRESRRFVVLFTNITERVRAEEEIKSLGERNREILESITDGFFTLDREWRFTYVNPQAEMILDRQPGDLVGSVIWDVYQIAGTDFERAYRRTANEGVVSIFTAYYPDHDRWYEANAYPAPHGITVYFRDISNRVRAEEILRHSEEKFRNLANSISQLAWMADATGSISWYNERWFEYTGTTLEEMQGWGWQKVHHPEEVERVTEKFKRHIASGEIWEDTFPIRSKTGQYCWFLSRALPIRDENDQIIRWFGTNTDITERREIEAERERLLEREQMAREIAERANHSKDEFIALVSHELRSPLNAMLGWTRILQKKQADEKTTEYALDVIIRNARAQSRLIEDLLDIARIGEGKLRIEMRATAIIPIIKSAIEIIKPAADGKNISIAESFDSAANFIHGDDDRLRQIIENLLSNAVKFTPAGGKVEILLKRNDKQTQIIVSDTGQGIPAGFLPEIFEKFRQADHSTTRRHGGLGIGLSLARDLVELHGGTIAAQSEGEGAGATFTVTLPLRSIMPIKQNSDTEGIMSSQGKLNGFWILAVDDEADAREIVSFMLQINGAKVTTANSAVEALEILKGANGRIPDILLSDISMPFESGYALLEKIRALPREHGGEIPAVALTAFNRPEDREAAFEAGFQKHLGKPVDMDALIDAIVETASARQI